MPPASAREYLADFVRLVRLSEQYFGALVLTEDRRLKLNTIKLARRIIYAQRTKFPKILRTAASAEFQCPCQYRAAGEHLEAEEASTEAYQAFEADLQVCKRVRIGFRLPRYLRVCRARAFDKCLYFEVGLDILFNRKTFGCRRLKFD